MAQRVALVPAGRVAATVAVLGAPVGLLWAWLAPPEVMRVVPGGAVVPLLGQSEHRFDALGVFLLLGLAGGVLVGVAAWLLRYRRGPALLLAAVLGAGLASALAVVVGEPAAAARHTGVLLAAPGATVALPPTVESWWVVLAAPFAVALTWTVLVACAAADDLSRGPP